MKALVAGTKKKLSGIFLSCVFSAVANPFQDMPVPTVHLATVANGSPLQAAVRQFRPLGTDPFCMDILAWTSLTGFISWLFLLWICGQYIMK